MSLIEKGSCSREPVAEKGRLLSNRPKRVSFNFFSSPTNSKSGNTNICVDLCPLEESPIMKEYERRATSVGGSVSVLGVE